MSAPIERPWESPLAEVLLRMFPPNVRSAILEQPQFQERFGLGGDVVLSVAQTRTRFLRSTFFEVSRSILSGVAAQGEVPSLDGEMWQVTADTSFGVTLAREGVVVNVEEVVCLSPDQSARVTWFVRQAGIYAELDTELAAWRRLLLQRPLLDGELQGLLTELSVTPTRVFAGIEGRLERGSFSPADLVPGSVRYFEQLAPEPPSNAGWRDFFSTALAAHVRALLGHHEEGLRTALLLASHSGVADLVDVGAFPRSVVLDTFSWVAVSGDRVSQVGAIECGLRLLGEWPELEPSLLAMTRELVEDDPANPAGRLQLTSGLVALVEGELSRRRIAVGRRPFWRRLTSIAHASVVEREVVRSGLDAASVAKWALNSSGGLFYLQTLVDLRQEPRWFPDFLSAEQLQAEWLGRVLNAAERFRDRIPDGELSDVLWGQHPGSVKSRLPIPEAFLPGPLEGGLEAMAELPKDLDSEIRSSLEAQELRPASFFGLLNAALIVRLSPELSEVAAEGLRRVGYALRNVGANDDPFPLLNGLAKVAAVTRSRELAAEVRVLARASRRRHGSRLSPEAMSRIGLAAAAASGDEIVWSTFLGEWLTELAFLEMTLEEALALQSHVHTLLHIEPGLWDQCGRAEAALAGYVGSCAATGAAL